MNTQFIVIFEAIYSDNDSKDFSLQLQFVEWI